jgi:hypothetical protein
MSETIIFVIKMKRNRKKFKRKRKFNLARFMGEACLRSRLRK